MISIKDQQKVFLKFLVIENNMKLNYFDESLMICEVLYYYVKKCASISRMTFPFFRQVEENPLSFQSTLRPRSYSCFFL